MTDSPAESQQAFAGLRSKYVPPHLRNRPGGSNISPHAAPFVPQSQQQAQQQLSQSPQTQGAPPPQQGITHIQRRITYHMMS